MHFSLGPSHLYFAWLAPTRWASGVVLGRMSLARCRALYPMGLVTRQAMCVCLCRSPRPRLGGKEPLDEYRSVAFFPPTSGFVHNNKHECALCRSPSHSSSQHIEAGTSGSGMSMVLRTCTGMHVFVDVREQVLTRAYAAPEVGVDAHGSDSTSDKRPEEVWWCLHGYADSR